MRRRYQKGNLVVRGKEPCYYGMYREDVQQPDGTLKRVRHCEKLGFTKDLSERAAWKLFQSSLEKVNTATKLPPKSGITLEQFVKEWRSLVAGNIGATTLRAAESHLRAHIVPKLGNLPLTEIKLKVVQGFVTYLSTGKRKRKRKTVENVLLTLSSILRIARNWDYACGNFLLADLTLPKQDVKEDPRSFTDKEVAEIIAAAPEPLKTILIVLAFLGLRIGEALALRVSDLDFEHRIVRIRQSVDAATRKVQALKSEASRADLPMPSQLEAQFRTHLQNRKNKGDLLFANRKLLPFSANKLRAKKLHPLLEKLGIPKGGFHALRHGVSSSLVADGANIAVVQRQLRHSDPRITLGIYTHVVGNDQRDAVENRSARITRLAVN